MSIVIPKLDKVHTTIESILSTYPGDGPIRCFWPHQIQKNVNEFRRLFAGKVVYAVKCNPDPCVLEALKEAKITGFDVASVAEIKSIHGWNADANLYFQHPVKSRIAIRDSYTNYGVRHFSVDHANELEKLLDELPNSRKIMVYVRIATPGLGVTEDLSTKFGASIEEAGRLLESINTTEFRPAMSFHVGSQCYDPQAYAAALSMVSKTLGRSSVAIGALNIGGGFPANYLGNNVPSLEVYMRQINRGLNSLSLSPEVEIFCEPGRSLVADGMSVVARVQLRKGNALYINDGIFGHFLEAYFHSYRVPARAIRPVEKLSEDIESFKVFGPTCDGNDALPGELELPGDLREGDWIEFSNMGAYSLALSSGFNGFKTESSIVIC